MAATPVRANYRLDKREPGLTLVRTYRMMVADLMTQDTFHSESEELWDGNDVEYELLKADWERTLRVRQGHR